VIVAASQKQICIHDNPQSGATETPKKKDDNCFGKKANLRKVTDVTHEEEYVAPAELELQREMRDYK
jgi:hypothetical protein